MNIKNFISRNRTYTLLLFLSATLAIVVFNGCGSSNHSGDYVSVDTTDYETLVDTTTTPQFPQATDFFQEFKSNKVAFDKEYDDKIIEFEGEISEITTSWGCAIIEIKAGSSAFDVIRCSNCPGTKDKWSKEVESVSVGQTVRIKGYYSAISSESYSMSLYKCHIINE